MYGQRYGNFTHLTFNLKIQFSPKSMWTKIAKQKLFFLIINIKMWRIVVWIGLLNLQMSSKHAFTYRLFLQYFYVSQHRWCISQRYFLSNALTTHVAQSLPSSSSAYSLIYERGISSGRTTESSTRPRFVSKIYSVVIKMCESNTLKTQSYVLTPYTFGYINLNNSSDNKVYTDRDA